MTKDITREEAHALRLMARLAFRNSVGATEDYAVKFDHREYSTLDLNFLWHFKMLIEEEERESIAKMFDDAPKLMPYAQNAEGGCLICGFTPKIAAAVIRKGEK